MNEVKTNRVHSEKQRNRNPGDVGATENFHDGSLSHKLSGIGCSSLIPTVPEQSFECIDRSKVGKPVLLYLMVSPYVLYLKEFLVVKQIVSYRGSDLPSHLEDFPRREIVSRNSEPSTLGIVHVKATKMWLLNV